MARCCDQRQDVLGRRLGRESRRQVLGQARNRNGSNFWMDIGGCTESPLEQGHARMILAQC